MCVPDFERICWETQTDSGDVDLDKLEEELIARNVDLSKFVTASSGGSGASAERRGSMLRRGSVDIGAFPAVVAGGYCCCRGLSVDLVVVGGCQ